MIRRLFEEWKKKVSYVCTCKVRELESRMETLQMEVEDFKGAVKLQSVAMDKYQSSR